MTQANDIIYSIGLMSGSSMDGLDVALCSFQKNNFYNYEIIDGKTFAYNDDLLDKLSEVSEMSAKEILLLDIELGRYYGECVNKFLKTNREEVKFISSHGHTIYHDIKQQLTCQIGNGAVIAAETKIPVVCDFRKTDVALGGQGAPLVPVGDRDLFSQYDICINLGGIINITNYDKALNKITAYDICAGNQVLNYFASKLGLEFDNNGETASKGMPVMPLLEKLNQLEFMNSKPPKSLDKFWIHQEVIPIMESTNRNVEDLLCTFCHHIALQISKNIPSHFKYPKLLITGGGAFNGFLVKLISQYCKGEIAVADDKLIKYKEALIFAYLGLLRWNNLPNVASSVTGASKDHSAGAIYLV